MYHERLRQIVADPEWQALRGSMVGTWKHEPKRNVRWLRRYLGRVRNRDHPKFIRVYNYLTGSAFRIGVISHPEITRLLDELRAAKR